MNEAACIPNVSARGRRRRLASGIAWLAVALAGAAVLLLAGARPPVLAILVIPFTLAALGWFQAKAKT